jgi:hypothetical protein
MQLKPPPQFLLPLQPVQDPTVSLGNGADHLDIAGNKGHHDSAHHIVDKFSKWAIVIPCSNVDPM